MVEAYRHLVDPVEGMTGDLVQPRALATYEVGLDELLDLRTTAARSQVGLTDADVSSPVGEYEACQRIGSLAHQRDCLPTCPPQVRWAMLHPEALARRQFGNWMTNADVLDTALAVGTLDSPIIYEDLVAAAERRDHEGVSVLVASIDDLIRAKELADRPKDHDALPELRTLRAAGDRPHDA